MRDNTTNQNATTRFTSIYFLQTVDIDLNNVLWSGITYFAGNYNGNGNVIANLYCNGSCYFQNSYKNYAPGLFMNTVGATIRNLTIENITMSTFGTSSAYGDAFCGALVAYGENTIIENCKVDNFSATITNKNNPAYIGGMVGQLYSGSMMNCNVNNLTMDVTTTETTYVGGVVGLAGTDNSNTRNVNLSDINCIDMSLTTYCSGYSDTVWTGGVVGYCFAGFNKSYASGMITSSRISTGRPLYGMVGGIIGFSDTGHVSEDMISYVDITAKYQCVGGIIGQSNNGLTKSAYYGTITISSANYYYHGAGGLIYQLGVSSTSGSDEFICNMSECLFDGSIIESVAAEYLGGIVAKSECDSHVTIYASNNLSQGEIIRNKNTSTSNYTVGLILDSNSEVSWVGTNNLGNCNLINNTTTEAYFETLGFVTNDGTTDTTCNYGNLDKATTVRYDPSVYTYDVSDDFIRDPASYASWTDFDTYWVINENLNNGYPILKAFVDYAQVTGFEGSGTQTDPYQIKTTADLQGMQAYYNEYQLIDEYWWILVNNIDISTDANDLTINWAPIGYEGGVATGFNGHFDGNGKTISGLTITEQYENSGLFGKVASNATITNLNVSGTI
ncbi:MAG: hypothetical protein J6C90_00005, partial [Clostridia bacterium]|nr:hypothetical protein [Clostridia bacterium]